MKDKTKKYKGKKFYGVIHKEYGNIAYESADIEHTKKGLDDNYSVLVEMTVTRVFTRERDLKEIETEIL